MTALTTATLSGVTSRDTNGYFAGVMIGNKYSEFGHAGVNSGLGVKGVTEFDGKVWFDSTIESTGSLVWAIPTSNSTSWRMRSTLGGSIKNVFAANTSGNGLVEINPKLYVGSGIVNQGGSGTGAVKQPQTFALALSADSGNGGMLAVANPLGSAAYVKDCQIHLSTGTGDSGGVNIGVGESAGSAVDNLFDGFSLQTARLGDNVNSAGTNGKFSRLLGASSYITATASGSPSAAVGYLYVTLQERL